MRMFKLGFKKTPNSPSFLFLSYVPYMTPFRQLLSPFSFGIPLSPLSAYFLGKGFFK